ncbi:MAG: molybdopterin synthase [Halobacteriaceae archaeon]
MLVVGVVASKADKIVDALRDHLGTEGSVGVVSRAEVEAPSGGSRYELGADAWRGHGGHLRVEEALDRLARNHDAAILVNFPTARAPQIVVGDAEVRREFRRIDDPDGLDYDSMVTELRSTPAADWQSLGSLVTAAKRHADEAFAGAIATFTGRVRAKDGPDDDRTEYLAFEQYDEVADDRFAAIRSELTARDGVYEVRLHHRTGVVEAGEDIVFVVVLAGHREEAFQAVEDGINRLKDEVPIFKKEVTVEETFWVHEEDAR